MSVAPPQVVQLSCPNCRATIRAQIVTMIDVGRQPELKNYLLSGQLNMVVCQSCGNVSVIAAPLIYHDPNKQLFLIHFPQQLNARADEQEHFIGDATTMIIRGLPNDAPKGYLLAPRSFLTLNALIETVLEADGISKEMIDSQRRRVDLISQLADVYEQTPDQLPALVEQHRDEFNYEFFATLTAFAQASTANSQDDSAQVLLQLRDELIALTGFEELSGEEEGEEFDVPLDELITRLAEAPEAELEVAIAELRPLLDYSFFEALTERIDALNEAGDTAAAEELSNRRTLIVETVERMDAQAKEMFEAGASLLTAALEADDPAEVLRANHQQIDEAFLLVLESNRTAAERAGRPDVAEQLASIRDQAIQIAQEALPPEDRFINQLLQVEQPQDATKLLRQNMGQVTTAFVKRLNELAEEFETSGRAPLADRLRQLARESAAMLF